MPVARCPSCDTPLTREEAGGVQCPSCKAPFETRRTEPSLATGDVPPASLPLNTKTAHGITLILGGSVIFISIGLVQAGVLLNRFLGASWQFRDRELAEQIRQELSTFLLIAAGLSLLALALEISGRLLCTGAAASDASAKNCLYWSIGLEGAVFVWQLLGLSELAGVVPRFHPSVVITLNLLTTLLVIAAFFLLMTFLRIIAARMDRADLSNWAQSVIIWSALIVGAMLVLGIGSLFLPILGMPLLLIGLGALVLLFRYFLFMVNMRFAVLEYITFATTLTGQEQGLTSR